MMIVVAMVMFLVELLIVFFCFVFFSTVVFVDEAVGRRLLLMRLLAWRLRLALSRARHLLTFWRARCDRLRRSLAGSAKASDQSVVAHLNLIDAREVQRTEPVELAEVNC